MPNHEQLAGQQFRVQLQMMDGPKIDSVAKEMREIMLELKEFYPNAGFEILIDGVPPSVIHRISNRLQTFLQSGIVTTNVENTLIQSIEKAPSEEQQESSIDKSLTLGLSGIHLSSFNRSVRGDTRSVSLQPSQDKLLVLKSSAAIRKLLATTLLDKLSSLPSLPIIQIADRNLHIDFPGSVDINAAITHGNRFLQDLLVQEVFEEDFPDQLHNYLNWLQDRKSITYIKQVAESNQRLKGYRNHSDQPARILIFSEKHDKATMSRLVDIECRLAFEPDNRAYFLEESFIPAVQAWIGKYLLTFICYREPKTYIIGPHIEVLEIQSLIQFERMKVAIQTLPLMVNQINAKIYDRFLRNELETFFGTDLPGPQINTANRFKDSQGKWVTILKDLYEGYLMDYEKKSYCGIKFGDKQGGRTFEMISNVHPDSNMFQLLENLITKQKVDQYDSYFVSVFVAPSQSGLTLLKEQLDEAISYETEIVNDDDIINFVSKGNKLSLLKSIMSTNKVLIDRLGKIVEIKGKRENIDKSLQLILADIQKEQRQVITFDFHSTFVLNVLKQYFKEKIESIRDTYKSDFRIDKCIKVEIQVSSKNADALQNELTDLRMQIEDSHIIRHQINSGMYEHFISIPENKIKLRRLEDTYAVSINQAANELATYLVHQQYLWVGKYKLRICSGNQEPFFKSKKGQNELANCSMVVPVMVLHRKPPEMTADILTDESHPFQQILKTSGIGKGLADQMNKLLQERSLVHFQQKRLELATPELEDQPANHKGKKASKQKQSTSVQPQLDIYYAFYEDVEAEFNFFNYFDKMRYERSVLEILAEIKRKKTVGRIIFFQSHQLKTDLSILSLVLDYLLTNNVDSTVIDFLVSNENDLDQTIDHLNSEVAKIGKQHLRQEKNLNPHQQISLYIKTYDDQRNEQVLAELDQLLLGEQ